MHHDLRQQQETKGMGVTVKVPQPRSISKHPESCGLDFEGLAEVVRVAPGASETEKNSSAG